ncbi:hypothetical protein [Burkholderia gladioli]|uniref:hypothetical protein n=1 Tax=Burkholderia gladioli TaxID=28095 RepID=UPI003017EE35
MSDKLSDEQIEAAKAAGFSWHPIWQCLVVRHSNGAWSEVSDKLARFAALLAASPAPAISESEWQPIETAPKDGSPVLLIATRHSMLYPHPEVIVGYWRSGWWSGPSALSHVTNWMPAPSIVAARKGEKS